MISHNDIKNLVQEWNLREDVIEKDYVLGWVLGGIGQDPDLSSYWAFKGGTSLKKCYVETWRFSEDLDFTVLPGGPVKPDEINPIIKRVLENVYEESGIDLLIREPKFKHSEKYSYTQGSIYYRGPRNTPGVSRIKLDISGSEKIACPTVLNKISHPYNDSLPDSATVRCYAFEEVFAEKLRAMGERGRPRDLYDIVLLFRRRDFQTAPDLIKSVLEKKCKSKNVPIPDVSLIENESKKIELIAEWENMLAHQLQVLPPIEQFLEEIPNIFNWLNGQYKPELINTAPFGKDEDISWAPPPTMWKWGYGIPLESIRYASANYLCIELEYIKADGTFNNPIIEPYSLRQTKDGNLILHAIKTSTNQHRCYRIDRIKSIKVTNKPFKPKYQIEFSKLETITILPTSRKDEDSFSVVKRVTRRRKTKIGTQQKYVFQCPACSKKFKRTKYDSKLRQHKDKFGNMCYGRTGYFVGNVFE